MRSQSRDIEKLVPSKRLYNSLYELWCDRVAGRALRTVLFLLVVLVLLVIAFYLRLPPEIPLAYSRPWGIAQLVPSSFLFMLAAGLSLLVTVHSIFAAWMFEAEQLLARIMVWINALTVLLIDITVLQVVLLII